MERSRANEVMLLTLHVAAAATALAIRIATASANAQPPAHTLSITCTNPFSGAAWQITVDYDRATVDSYPAKVSDSAISWHDARDGGNYTLDRRSGALTVVVPSSTGGYLLHHSCRLPPPGGQAG